MLHKFFKSYSNFFDKKLENWTIVVLIIAILIVVVSILIWESWWSILKSKNNVLEISQNNPNKHNIIEIQWTKYKITLEEVRK